MENTIQITDEYIAYFTGPYCQSLMYLDETKETDLPFKYMQYFADFIENLNFNNILLLGGGGFNFPKYLANNYPDKKITVIEKNLNVINLAYKFFNLEKYDSKLNIIIQDAIKYLQETQEIYDIIIVDLFDNGEIVKVPINLLKNHCKNFIINVIGEPQTNLNYICCDEEHENYLIIEKGNKK